MGRTMLFLISIPRAIQVETQNCSNAPPPAASSVSDRFDTICSGLGDRRISQPWHAPRPVKVVASLVHASLWEFVGTPNSDNAN
jgi:hypothetical protein